MLAHIQTGDILLLRYPRRPQSWRPRALFGWLVSWVVGLISRSVFSHVGIALRIRVNGHDAVTIIEATSAFGVRLFPLGPYLRNYDAEGYSVDWWQVADATINREAVASYCLAQWGKPYASWVQMLWSFGQLAKVRRWLGLPAAIDGDSRYFCSKLVHAAFVYAGYVPPEGDETDSDLIDPGEVALYTCARRRGRLLVETGGEE